jgi:hypothetical protein
MVSGDILVFYRTASGGPAHYTSVATTLGIVESVITGIPSAEKFIEICRKRSVFSDDELRLHWNYNPNSRPFVVNFLYTYSLPRRPNFASMKEQGIVCAAPRGFEQLTDSAFFKLLEISNGNLGLVVG